MTNIIAKAGGLLSDPTDQRDYDFVNFDRLVTTSQSLPDEHMIPERTPISNQGRLNSCAANAACDAVETVMVRPVQLSRLFAYWTARATHGATGVDKGTYLRAVFKQMAKIGAVPEVHWTYQHSKVNKSPPSYHFMEASENRLRGYYRIKETGQQKIDQIKRAIAANHPVAFGMVVSETFQALKTKATGLSYRFFDMVPPFAGGHAMMIVGYGKDNYFHVRNSWGRNWGENGYCWMSDELIEEKAFDLWVPTFIREVR